MAQWFLGECYYRGEGVEKDVTKAEMWLKKSATQGFVHAQFSLGMYYKNCRNTKAYQDLAREWLEKAAAQGHKMAEAELQNW